MSIGTKQNTYFLYLKVRLKTLTVITLTLNTSLPPKNLSSKQKLLYLCEVFYCPKAYLHFIVVNMSECSLRFH